jgi:hypothetical protein
MKKTLLSLLLFIPFIGFGQINIATTQTVTENFNGIGATATASLPTNWKADKINTVRTLGTYAAAVSATERVEGESIATNASNGIYNLGIAPEASSTDRAIGFLSSSSATQSGNLYSFFQNSGVTPIQSFTISYNVEKYRNGSNAAGFSIQLYYSTNGSSWVSAGTAFTTSIGADADNLGTATPPISTTAVGSSFNPTLPINQNENIYFAWNYSVTSGTTTSNAQALSIDDISITANATLPISLTSFTGKAVDKSVLLNWETASESNNEYFEVLKSSNGKSFTAIGTVKGSGTTTSAKSYSLVDNNPAAGTNYYQLVQYDFDGKSSKSDVIPVNSSIANSSLTVYAAASSVNVSINSANATDGTLQIFDITGKKLNETKLSLSKGFNTLSLPLSLNSGIHVVNFVTGSEVIKTKFIKD